MVTDAVHAAGGRIFVQLMHAGRVSHSSLLPERALPVAPSAIAVSGEIHTFDGKMPFETPRPFETEEIPAVIEEYRRQPSCRSRQASTAWNFMRRPATFRINFRSRGRTIAPTPTEVRWKRRSRFTLEVIEALCSVRGADRVGIKIAPGFTVNDTFDDDPAETYTYLARSLNGLGLAYLHVGYDSGYGRGTAPPFNPDRPPAPGVRRHVAGGGRIHQGIGRGGVSGGSGRCNCLCKAVHFQSRPRGSVSARCPIESLGCTDLLRRRRSRLHRLSHAG